MIARDISCAFCRAEATRGVCRGSWILREGIRLFESNLEVGKYLSMHHGRYFQCKGRFRRRLVVAWESVLSTRERCPTSSLGKDGHDGWKGRDGVYE